MSKLTREECTSIFRGMIDSKDLSQKYRDLYRILGPGIWLLHGSSGDQIRVMKPNMAIYVPMESLSMFFLSSTLTSERVDPTKEMLLGIHYGTSYLWVKAPIVNIHVLPKRPSVATTKVIPPKSVRSVPKPMIASNIPPSTISRNAAILSRRR